MSYRQISSPTKRRPAKRLLDDVSPTKSSAKPKIIVRQLTADDNEDADTTPPSSTATVPAAMVSDSSSTLKRVEEIKKETQVAGVKETSSPDPTLLGVPLISGKQITNTQQLPDVRQLFFLFGIILTSDYPIVVERFS